MQSPISFLLGLIFVVCVAMVYRLVHGLQLQLLLVHREGMRSSVSGREGRDQIVIPVTMENRRAASWRGIKEKRWRESVDLVLADDEGRYADLGFTFHPWLHFVMQVGEPRKDTPTAEVKLNYRPVPVGRRVRVVNGDRLEVGQRRYSVRVTSSVTDSEAGSI